MRKEDPFSRCPECKGPMDEQGPMGRLLDGHLILKRIILEGTVPEDLTPLGVQRYTEAREALEDEYEED